MKAQRIELNVPWSEYRPLYERGLEIEARQEEIRKDARWRFKPALVKEAQELSHEDFLLDQKKEKLREHLIPEVGMPCTVYFFSDRSSGYIEKVLSPKSFLVKMDGVYSGRKIFSHRKNGIWLEKGATIRSHGTYCALGYKYNYYDLSF